MAKPSASNLVWLDLEMTGLNPDRDRIMEIATIITDSELNILAEGPVFAIHQSNLLLNQMDKWCTDQHGKSGLTKRVQNSNTSEATAEAETLAFIKKWVPELVNVPETYIHEPWTMSMMEQTFCDLTMGVDYPMPIVDLKESAKKARDKIWGHKKHPAVNAEKSRILATHVNKRK